MSGPFLCLNLGGIYRPQSHSLKTLRLFKCTNTAKPPIANWQQSLVYTIIPTMFFISSE